MFGRYTVRATSNGLERGRYLTRRRAQRTADRMNRLSRYHRAKTSWEVVPAALVRAEARGLREGAARRLHERAARSA